MTLFDLEPVDADARARIRGDLDANLFVEAGAGTGKTKVLVDRVVELVASGRLASPRRLAAITFTEAAASELRDRIRRALEVAAVDPDLTGDDTGRQRCRQAVAAIEEATITTLHGFAQRILAEFPLAAGLPPTFDVVDELTARVDFAQRWSDFLDELFADPGAEDDLILGQAVGLYLGRLRDLALQLERRWERTVAARFPGATVPAFDAGAVIDPITAAVELAGERIEGDDKLAGVLRVWRDTLALLLQAGANGGADEVLRLIAELPSGCFPAPGNLGKGDYWGSGDKETIAGLLAGARSAALEQLAAIRSALLDRFLPRLARFVTEGVERRRRQARLEFHDLLVLARDLLRADAEVRVALAERFQVLLVDEFQDTDPLQVDIVFAVAAADPAADPVPWTEAVLAPGKVVVVGDPKQSIYGFRGADITLWERTRQRFPAGVEQLRQSFRSVPQVLEWVNCVFEAVIGDGVGQVQPPYQSLAAVRPALHDAPAVVVLGEPAAGLSAADVREREAADVASLIARMKFEGWTVQGAGREVRPLRYEDIALLLPTRTPLPQLERALDEVDIPYRVESRSLVWGTDDVRELLAVLSAIEDPGDEVAVVAALRSPGFACTDLELYQWAEAGGRWRPAAAEEQPDELRDHPVAVALGILAGYREASTVLPVGELVNRVVTERRLIQLAFAHRRPRDHWRRLRFVVDQAHAFVEAGGRSLADFVGWARLQADEGASVTETPVPEADDDAVRILTIHGSKGLEFPVVVLAGLGSARRDVPPQVVWSAERPEVRIGPKGANFETAGYEEASFGLGDAAAYEGRRLLYVAATRARDHLVVSLHHKDGAKPEPHAATLWKLCAGGGPAAAWCRSLAGQGSLALVVPPAPPVAGDALVDRDEWLGHDDALRARLQRRRVVPPTAIAQLALDAASGAEDAPEAQPDPEPESPAADEQAAPPPRAFRRGGTAIGRAVHGVLQTIDLASHDAAQLAALAAVHAGAEGVPDDATTVERLAASALDAPVIRQAAAAERVWREVYVGAPVREAPGGRLIEGYIDLVVEEPDGRLLVVDYKTDSARDDAALERSLARYRLQGAGYALAVSRSTARDVSRVVFVFCRPGGAVEREITDLDAAMKEAVDLVAG